jgi:hypothetical protein
VNAPDTGSKSPPECSNEELLYRAELAQSAKMLNGARDVRTIRTADAFSSGEYRRVVNRLPH